MKLVHLADTHLGFRQFRRTVNGRNEREQDVYSAFARAVERVIELRPDAVVHAGDLFDGFHPSSAALAVALDGFEALRGEQIPVVCIAGNHSTPRFTSAEHVFSILDRFDGVEAIWREPRTVRLGELAVHGVPHQADAQRLVQDLKDATRADDAKFNVLVAHVGFDGLPLVGSAESNSVSLAGDELEHVAAFDYIALGHLHQFGGARVNAVYSGSVERLSWHDRAAEKGIVEVDLAKDPRSGEFVCLHPLPARRYVQLDPIDASKVDGLTEAIVEAAATDELVGAIVRVPIRNVTPAAFASVDRIAVERAFNECFHHELAPDILPAPSADVAAPSELRDYLLARVPSGIDSTEFVNRAQEYIARVDEEMAS